jgi:c-di-GMP-binding flagellar brake protein YcgR
MPRRPKPLPEQRQSLRVKLPAMYTLIRVRKPGEERYRWTGYIYDISASGMRFELDSEIEPGTPVDVRAMLPGARHTTISATGRIVRRHDDADEPGPVRMGMIFDRFAGLNRRRLMDYLETVHAAAA